MYGDEIRSMPQNAPGVHWDLEFHVLTPRLAAQGNYRRGV